MLSGLSATACNELVSWLRSLDAVPDAPTRRAIALHGLVAKLDFAFSIQAAQIEELALVLIHPEEVVAQCGVRRCEPIPDCSGSDDDKHAPCDAEKHEVAGSAKRETKESVVQGSGSDIALVESARGVVRRGRIALDAFCTGLHRWMAAPTYDSLLAKTAALAFVAHTKAAPLHPAVPGAPATAGSSPGNERARRVINSARTKLNQSIDTLCFITEDLETLAKRQPDPALRFAGFLITIRSVCSTTLLVFPEGDPACCGMSRDVAKRQDMLNLRRVLLPVLDDLIDHASSPLMAPQGQRFGDAVEAASRANFQSTAAAAAARAASSQ